MIGLSEFTLALGIVAAIWIYRAWPEWALYRLGKAMEIPRAYLLNRSVPLPDKLLTVQMELRQRYTTLYYRIRDLGHLMPEQKLRNELNELLQPASEHDVNSSTWAALNEALTRIEEDGPKRALPQAVALAIKVYELEDFFARYHRIEKRIELPEVSERA